MKVLLGDDHRLVRDGLRLQLQEFDPSLEIIDAADFPGMFASIDAHGPFDLVLVDLGMPGMDWEDALRILAADHPSWPLVVVSATDDRATILRTLDLGVAGFIPKTSSGDVMISALRLVLSGGVYLPKEVLRGMADGAVATGSASSEIEEAPSLSPRQTEILLLIAEGNSNKQIAATLGLSDGTIKTHVSSILRTLNARNRTQAILAASRLGLVRVV